MNTTSRDLGNNTQYGKAFSSKKNSKITDSKDFSSSENYSCYGQRTKSSDKSRRRSHFYKRNSDTIAGASK